MRSLRARLMLSHVLPILVVVALVAFALTYLLETQVLLAQYSDQLEQQARLVARAASNNLLIWSDPGLSQGFITAVGESLPGRVWLLNRQGVLLASSHVDDRDLIGVQQSLPGLREVVATGAILRVDYGEVRGTGAAEVLVPVVVGGRVAGVIRMTDPLSSVYERFPRTRRFILSVLAAGLGVGVVMGLALAAGLERPLRLATGAISRMAAGERLGALPEQGPEEIRMLLRAFNALTERLQGLERARKRLLANLVHELGRPLGALLAAIQAQQAGAEEEPDVRRELLSGMEAEVRRMGRLLDDLTRLYDQALGQLELDRTPTLLTPWLHGVLLPWREAAQEKRLRWEVDLPDDLPTAAIDPDRMAQAVGNLLSNAVRYTPAEGSVRVSATAGADSVAIRVEDTGPGVPPEERERIFAPFYRGARGTRFPQGMGLGLSIARDVVEAHGGRIELDGSAPSRGSTFIIHFPLRPEPSAMRESTDLEAPLRSP